MFLKSDVVVPIDAINKDLDSVCDMKMWAITVKLFAMLGNLQ